MIKINQECCLFNYILCIIYFLQYTEVTFKTARAVPLRPTTGHTNDSISVCFLFFIKNIFTLQ